jgi:hypothetical protein
MGLFTTRSVNPSLVWLKGHAIPGMNRAEWCRDDFGHTLNRWDHGNQDSPHGWQVDHIVPAAIGGSDDLGNLRPLHCGKNASLGGILGSLLSKG